MSSKYVVYKTFTEYVTIEAESEQDALAQATEISSGLWYTDTASVEYSVTERSPEVCDTCNGAGTYETYDSDTYSDVYVHCGTCDGTGKVEPIEPIDHLCTEFCKC